MNRNILAGMGAAILAAAVGGFVWLRDEPGEPAAAVETEAPAGALSAKQLERLNITTKPAALAETLPLGTVPGTVTLPPEARVAVTAPFAGAAIRIFVIEGQQVRQGDPLAIVRAAEPVQYGAELARARSELALAETRAARLDQLAREGVVAGARADEAGAQLRQTRATVAEHQRLLALAGAGADGTMTLRAPISGRLARVAVETGGPVGGMTAPFVIENTSAYRVDLQLPERLSGQVHPGMTVTVQSTASDAQGQPVPVSGRILSVGASLDPATRSLPAKAHLETTAGLVSGKGVMVVIHGAGSATGVTVPAAAVTQIEGKDHVFVRERTRFVRRPVNVAAQNGAESVISDGVRPGEPVAVTGVAELKALLAE